MVTLILAFALVAKVSGHIAGQPPTPVAAQPKPLFSENFESGTIDKSLWSLGARHPSHRPVK